MATITETIVTDSAAASSAEQGGAKPRVRWNEDGIAKDMEERGKVYGTMKIDQVETPFIYYDEEDDPMVSQYKPNGEPEKMEAVQLQDALGILAEQQKGNCGGAQPMQQWERADRRMEFLSNRDKLYSQEAAVSSNVVENVVDLPEGWTAHKSSSSPIEIYYFCKATGKSQWEKPTEEEENQVDLA